MDRSFEWKRTSETGRLETGLFVSYEMKPDFLDDHNYPETMIVIHCYGNNNKVSFISARFYFKGKKQQITDGFFHWVSDDVRYILEEDFSFSVAKDFVMHSEYYADISMFPRMIPFTLGAYSL